MLDENDAEIALTWAKGKGPKPDHDFDMIITEPGLLAPSGELPTQISLRLSPSSTPAVYVRVS